MLLLLLRLPLPHSRFRDASWYLPFHYGHVSCHSDAPLNQNVCVYLYLSVIACQ